MESKEDKPENNLTISTKLSTDQLICKSPQNSPSASVKSLKNEEVLSAKKSNAEETPIVLYFGVLQVLFGLLMAVFGVLVLVHDANMSQIGGGLWGGCLAALTGVMGVFSIAKDCCPLKSHFQRIAQTSFLALSLVSLAVAHLVLVISAIGLARDSNNTEYEEPQTEGSPMEPPRNYSSILANAGLLLVSGCECVAAGLAAYHCARALCPCFRPQGERGPSSGVHRGQCVECSSHYAANKEMFVSNWLGKQAGFGPMYVVPATKGISPVNLAPVFTVPPPNSMMPPMMGYPLIPAPLGPTPPPIIRHNHIKDKYIRKRQRQPAELHVCQVPQDVKSKKTKRPKDKPRQITTEEVAKTYTGLDRVIAEEFIEICDSARNTSTSNSSSSETTACTNSETASRDFVEKL